MPVNLWEDIIRVISPEEAKELKSISKERRTKITNVSKPVATPKQLPRRELISTEVEQPRKILTREGKPRPKSPAVRVAPGSVKTTREGFLFKQAPTRGKKVFKKPAVRKELGQQELERLKSFLHQAEGGKEVQKELGHFRRGRFFPYPSVEGGAPTVGFGHKMDPGEVIRKGLTEAEADKLLEEDLSKATGRAKDYIEGRFGSKAWDKLDDKRKAMATEFAFNLGNLEKFPKFTKALIEGDWETIAEEYKRYYTTESGETKELAGRNRLFYETYIEPNLRKKR